MKVENAVITSTFLGYDEHGALTFSIGLDGNGWGVNFGNIALDEFSKDLDKRIPSSKGLECIATILEIVGVEKWEDLKGKYIRVEIKGFFCPVSKIGNILEDKWFDLNNFFKV